MCILYSLVWCGEKSLPGQQGPYSVEASHPGVEENNTGDNFGLSPWQRLLNAWLCVSESKGRECQRRRQEENMGLSSNIFLLWFSHISSFQLKALVVDDSHEQLISNGERVKPAIVGRDKKRSRIQRKTWCTVWDPMPELIINSPYVHSRIDSNTLTMGNPMPESTFASQSGTLNLASDNDL
jgi:hypothetical protein